MALTKIAVIIMVVVTAGCATSQFVSEAGDCPRSPGYSEISADGMLVVHFVEGPGVEIREVHAPADIDYHSWVIWAGNPRPGERKSIPIYLGRVSMRSDGTIDMILSGANIRGVVYEPTSGQIRSSTPEYQQMIDRVGGLRPGEFRGIPPLAGAACGNSISERH